MTEAPFLAREAELSELAAVLAESRLLTLTGPGGIGKTRLAGELGRRAGAPSARGPTWSTVAEKTDRDQLAGLILRDLGRREDPGRPPLDTLAAELGDDRVLIVVDNCERLVGEAPAAVAELLGRCPGCRILATGRRPLGIPGERVWPVPPLSLPSGADERGDAASPLALALGADAPRLLLARIERHDPAFTLDAAAAAAALRICETLDGFPLAIELAAARAADLGLEATAAALRGNPADGIEASLEWSYGLLAPGCRQLLRRLGVLAGTDTAGAAAVAGAADPAAVERDLTTLAELGLVAARTEPVLGTRRYELLDTIADFARARLAEAGEAGEARDLHLRHFASLAADSRDLLTDVAGRRTMRLEAGNLRAALTRAIEHGDPRALEICVGLTYWWFADDRFAEGRELCARALAACPDAPAAARVLVLRSAALLAVAVEDYAGAHAYAVEAHGASAAGVDPRVRGLGLQGMNLVLGTVDPAAAASSGREAVGLLRAGDEHDLAHALLTLAVAEALRDRFDSFARLRAEFVALPAGRGDDWLLNLMDLHAAWALLGRGDPRAALAESEAVLRRLGPEVSTRAALAEGFRLYALALGGEAARALEEGLDRLGRARAAGSEVGAAAIELGVAVAELALGDLDGAAIRAAAGLDSPALHGAAFWNDVMAAVAVERGDAATAVLHGQALEQLAARSGSPRQLGRGIYFRGLAALSEGRLEESGDLLHASLLAQTEGLCERDAIDTLEALGRLAERREDAERGARLAGAVVAARRERGCVRVPGAAAAIDPGPARGGGGPEIARARAEGERLGLSDALAYARRGRGRRERALAGWASLTPAEGEVAGLAAAGLSNPQIAARLFMSRSTVKTHLSRAFAKLGVANRTELAAIRSAPEADSTR